jgi:hypothetical protein
LGWRDRLKNASDAVTGGRFSAVEPPRLGSESPPPGGADKSIVNQILSSVEKIANENIGGISGLATLGSAGLAYDVSNCFIEASPDASEPQHQELRNAVASAAHLAWVLGEAERNQKATRPGFSNQHMAVARSVIRDHVTSAGARDATRYAFDLAYWCARSEGEADSDALINQLRADLARRG